MFQQIIYLNPFVWVLFKDPLQHIFNLRVFDPIKVCFLSENFRLQLQNVPTLKREGLCEHVVEGHSTGPDVQLAGTHLLRISCFEYLWSQKPSGSISIVDQVLFILKVLTYPKITQNQSPIDPN